MTKKPRVKLLVALSALSLIGAGGAMNAHADDHGSGGILMLNGNIQDDHAEENEKMMKKGQETRDSINEEQQQVNQALEELKAQTVPNYESRVDLNAPDYFGRTEQQTPVAEQIAPAAEERKNYVYKKKSGTAPPSRAFNNVR